MTPTGWPWPSFGIALTIANDSLLIQICEWSAGPAATPNVCAAAGEIGRIDGPAPVLCRCSPRRHARPHAVASCFA